MMRVLTIAAAIGVLCCGFSAVKVSGAPVYWVPNADGEWVEPTNWSSDPDRPGADDDVTIDVGGPTARTITTDGIRSVTVHSLQCEENLILTGTGSSQLSFKIGAGGGLINGELDLVDCALHLPDGGAFSANGATTLEDSSLLADEGGQLSLPNLTSWTLPSSSTNSIFAQGVDGGATALVDLPALGSILGGASSKFYLDAQVGGILSLPVLTLIDGYRLTVEAVGSGSSVDLSSLLEGLPNTTVLAEDGGVVDLRSMTTCLTYTADIAAYGTGSRVDLSSLSSLRCSNSSCPTGLAVLDGGQIILSDTLTELDGACLTVGQGQLPTEHFTRFVGATVNVLQGVTRWFDSLTELEDCTVYAREGATASFPSLTTIASLGDYGLNSWGTDGSGNASVLDLSSVTAIHGGGDIEAADGGMLDLSSLESLTGGYWIEASDEGSVVDLSALTALDNLTDDVTFRATHGGRIILPDTHTKMNHVRLFMSTGGTLACDGLEKMWNGKISIGSESLILPNLTDFYNCTFVVGGGAHLVLPALATVRVAPVHSWQDPVATLEAVGCDEHGAPSLLDLSSVLQVTGSNWLLGVYATDGAAIDLSSLTSLSSGSIDLLAEGPGSIIDVSALSVISSEHDEWSSDLRACDGGELVISPGLQQLDRVDITVSGGGILDTGEFRELDDCGVTAKEDSSLSFPNVTYARDLWLYTTEGGSIAFPELNALLFSEGFYSTWTAIHIGDIDLSSVTSISGDEWDLNIDTRIGSLVDLSALETIVGDDWRMDITLLSGGDAVVDFSSLVSADNGKLNVEVHGYGCVMDLSSLATTGVDAEYSAYWKVTYDGRLLINQTGPTEVRHMDVSAHIGGIISGHTLQLGTGTTLTSDTCIDATLHNVAGIVEPKTYWGEPAVLEIGGDFTQESGGTLKMDIVSLFVMDELIVSGDAWLDGRLMLNISSSLDLQPNQNFPILSIGGKRHGRFVSREEGSVVWTDKQGDRLYITYRGGPSHNWVVLTTCLVPEPPTLVLLGIALLGFAGYTRRRRSRAAE